MQAFNRNGIGYVRLEASGKKENIVAKFNEDPAIAVFFLVSSPIRFRVLSLTPCSPTAH